MESSPEKLWRLIDPIHQRFTAGQRLPAVHAETLAEAYFRIGVHPGTAPDTAVELLGHAHRLEPANPKHPYHLGLLHLRRGQPEQALQWFEAAAVRSPVNHRVRAHMSFALRELDALRQDASGYTGADRALSEKIAIAVRAGEDDFDLILGVAEEPVEGGAEPDQQAAKTVALIRPGVCRWSGIRDVEAEGRLRARTTERTRDALAAELVTIGDLAHRRRGGNAAFTVLAVQWMICGYPVETVRRLARALPPGDGPSARLLALVCELFETDPAELASRLAACLAERSLPDVLVALIHHQRLLWRPLCLPDLGAYAAARGADEDEPERHVKALETIRRGLLADRPEPMRDVAAQGTASGEAGESATPDARLADFERAAGALKELRNEVRACTKKLSGQEIATEADYARVAGDRRLLETLINDLEQARTTWLADLQQFMESEPTGHVMEFGEFQRRLENCESGFQAPFRSLITPLKKRVDKPLAQARARYGDVEPAPSQETEELAARLAALGGSGQPASAPRPTVPASATASATATADATSGAPAGIAEALAGAEQALDANFEAAWQTLEAYPTELWHRDALVLLRGHIGGRQSEADFRLGRSSAARRRWNSLLADDPLHPGVWHNLAVAHSCANDPVEAAEAWGRYVESIYLRDLLHGDVRRGAAERAALHRVLAASFGTAPLCRALLPGEEDAERREAVAKQIPSLLGSRAKVALVTDHLRLDEVNHTVSHRSPVLLLGIGRSDGDGAPAARERRAESVGKAAAILPARVREAFQAECLRLLDQAGAEVSEAKGRVRRRGDEAEESAHAEWVERRILWKRGIFGAVAAPEADWPLTDYSGAVIANLRLIDESALDAADPVVWDRVQQFFPGDGPKEMVEFLNGLSGVAADFAYKQILAAAEAVEDTTADTRRFAERFGRIGRSWARGGVSERWLALLDDPVKLYGPSVKAALELLADSDGPADEAEREVAAAAVPVLQEWVERLPGATGPARVLARLLGLIEQYEEALRVLDRADAQAFSVLGREKLLRGRILLDILRGRFSEAVAVLGSQLAAHPDDQQLRGLLISAFDRWIKAGEDVPTPQTIAEAFARWSDEDTTQIRRILALNAALAAHDEAKSRIGPLVETLRAMVAADPEHLMAHCQLSEALLKAAWECRIEMQTLARSERDAKRDDYFAALLECHKASKALLPRLAGSEYSKQRARLEEILEQVGEALGPVAELESWR